MPAGMFTTMVAMEDEALLEVCPLNVEEVVVDVLVVVLVDEVVLVDVVLDVVDD